MISGINDIKLIPACALIIVGILIGTMFTSIVQNNDEQNDKLVLYNEQLQERIVVLEDNLTLQEVDLANISELNDELNELIREQNEEVLDNNLIEKDEIIVFGDGRRGPSNNNEKIKNLGEVKKLAKNLQKSVVIVWDCYQSEKYLSYSSYSRKEMKVNDDYYVCNYIGTGYFITTNGCILTNNHVAPMETRYKDEDGIWRSRTIIIEYENQTFEKAYVRESVEDNKWSTGDDITLLKVNSRNHTPVKFATSNPAKGEQVVTVGHPGKLGFWVKSVGTYNGKDSMGNMFNTIPLSPGASGSPVVNMKGELVAMLKAGDGDDKMIMNPIMPSNNLINSIYNFGITRFEGIEIVFDSVFEIKTFLSSDDAKSCMP